MKQAILLVYIVFLFSSVAGAQTYQSSVSRASGSAGRASIEPIDVIFLNPATLVHLQGRHFTSSVQSKNFHVGLTDNTKQSQIPGGLGYLQGQSDYLGMPADNKNLHLSLADFLTKQIGLGFTAHYLETTWNEARYRQFNGHLSAIWTPTPDMGVGLVMYNLVPAQKEIPDEFKLTPSVGLGFNSIYNQFVRFRFDVRTGTNLVADHFLYGAGFESYFTDWFIARGGVARDDQASESWATAGLGFLGPRFYINYAYERTLSRNERREDRNAHSIDFGVPF